jgi:hypothetical protein
MLGFRLFPLLAFFLRLLLSAPQCLLYEFVLSQVLELGVDRLTVVPETLVIEGIDRRKKRRRRVPRKSLSALSFGFEWLTSRTPLNPSLILGNVIKSHVARAF